MFEAFKVGITVALTNQVSSVLQLIARDFAKTDAQAIALKASLKDIALIGASGALLGGLGYAGFRAISSMVKPATEYAHQLNIMNMAGLSQVEIAHSIGDAWKNTGSVITTTATQNLRMLLDLRNVLGNFQEAESALPIVSKIQAVMASSSEAGVRQVAQDNFAFNMAKALDIIGAANNPQDFERQAGEMAKAITGTQARVTPAMFQSVFAYARQAKFGMDDEFKYSILPTLMLEYAQGSGGGGGGSRGVGPALAAFSRLTLQGYINRKAMPELASLGLINPGSALQTTTTGTTVGAMKGADLAAANPFLWTQQVLMPAIEKKFGGHATTEQITQEIQSITRGNQLASQLMLEFALKSQNFLREQRNIHGAMGYQDAYLQAVRNDPNLAYQAAAAQWENLQIVFGSQVIPFLVPAIQKLATGLNTLSLWAEDHPNLTAGLTDGFIALSASLAFSGVVLTLTAAFKALRLVMTIGGFASFSSLLPASLTAVGAAATPLIGTLGSIAAGLIAITGAAAGLVAFFSWLAPKGGAVDPKTGKMMHGSRFGTYPNGIPTPEDHPLVSGEHNRFAPQNESKSSAGVLQRLEQLLTGGLTVVMDGETVGKIVTDHQAKEGNKPPSGPSDFDYSLSPLYPTGVW